MTNIISAHENYIKGDFLVANTQHDWQSQPQRDPRKVLESTGRFQNIPHDARMF
jgi:hypothetical protein